MPNIDEILDDVESGKVSPVDAADKFEKRNVRFRFRRASGTIFFGVYLILQGLAVMAYQLGWLPATGSAWNIVWPVMLFTGGVSMIADAIVRRRFSLFGLFLILIGAGRMVVNAAWIGYADWWSWFWPMLLIAAGLEVIISLLVRRTLTRGPGPCDFHWD